MRLFLIKFSLIVLCIAQAIKAVGSTSAPDTQTVTPRTILVLGDSLSAAYNLKIDDGWVHLLKNKLLEPSTISTLGAYQVVNASISGATTAAGLQVLPKLLEQHQPQIVLLELGANDGLQGKPISVIRKNLQTMIELSLDNHAQVLLIGIRLPPNYGKAYTEPFFSQYKTLASQYNLNYLPFLLEGVAGRPEAMMSDQLHPNRQAQPIILDNVWQQLNPMLIKPKHINPKHIKPTPTHSIPKESMTINPMFKESMSQE